MNLVQKGECWTGNQVTSLASILTGGNILLQPATKLWQGNVFYTCLSFCPQTGVVSASCAVHAGRYGQQVGGTHPTGMHSCSLDFFVFM